MSARRTSIAVIGDGTVDDRAPHWPLAESLGERLVDAGFRVVTGGLGGIMEAACRGAHRSHRYQPGDTVGILPGHDAAAANRFVDVAIPTGLLHGRNLVVAQSDAVIAIGGGAGTLAEMAYAWIHNRLLIAFRVHGWSGKLAGTRIDGRVRFVSIPDDHVFGVDSAEEAIAMLAAKLPTYLSAR
jgi:uncharacterized protein (TIGR00725 family)